MADSAPVRAALARLSFVVALWAQGNQVADRPVEALLLPLLMALWVARQLGDALPPRQLTALGLCSGAAALALPGPDMAPDAPLWALWGAALFAFALRPMALGPAPTAVGHLSIGERLAASLAVAALLSILLLPVVAPSVGQTAAERAEDDAEGDRCEPEDGHEDSDEDEDDEPEDSPLQLDPGQPVISL